MYDKVVPEAGQEYDTAGFLHANTHQRQALPIGHQYHLRLQQYHIYIPLSLFTDHSLNLLNHHPHNLTLTQVKYGEEENAYADVLDTEAFQIKYGREEDLSYELWLQASINYIRFLYAIGIDSAGRALASRWDEHFSFLQSRDDSIAPFSIILELDIHLRKLYHCTPFRFSVQCYQQEFDTLKKKLQG
jgi:hypothetical protein